MALHPEIYVACLASYNAGILHGVWLEVESLEDMQANITVMLAASTMPDAEEWAIHDTSDLGCIDVQRADLQDIVLAADFLRTYGELGAEVLAMVGDLERAQYWMEECYLGAFDSEVDFAQQWMAECYDIPEYLASYVDYQAVARDWLISAYDSIPLDGQVHIFHRD